MEIEEEEVSFEEIPSRRRVRGSERGTFTTAHLQLNHGDQEAHNTAPSVMQATIRSLNCRQQATGSSDDSMPGTSGPQAGRGEAGHPAAAQQIGQLQAELAAVRQSLATYESTLQMLVSELGTQALPSALQQLQHVAQRQPKQQLSVEQELMPAAVSTATSAADMPQHGAAQSGAAPGPKTPTGSAEAPPDTLYAFPGQAVMPNTPAIAHQQAIAASQEGRTAAAFVSPVSEEPRAGQDVPERQLSLQQWGQLQHQPQDSRQQEIVSSPSSTPDTAGARRPFQHMLGAGAQHGAGAPELAAPAEHSWHAQQQATLDLPTQQQQQLLMRHSEPLPMERSQQQGGEGPQDSTSASQLGSSFSSTGLGPFGTSFSGISQQLDLLNAADVGSSQLPTRSSGRSSLSPLGQRPWRPPQQQQQQSPSPRAPAATPSGAPGLAGPSGSSLDYLGQGLGGLMLAQAGMEDQEQQAAASGMAAHSGQRPVSAADSVDVAADSSLGALTGAAVSAAAAAGSRGTPRAAAGAGLTSSGAGPFSTSFNQSQQLSSSLDVQGAFASGSGLSLPVLAQGAHLMGLVPPPAALNMSHTGGRAGLAPLSGTPSPGESVEGTGGLLLQASLPGVSSALAQEPLPAPGIIHHLLTDTAGSLDLMSGLSPATGLPGGAAAAAAAAAVAAAAAASYNSSFGSEHSMGSLGMLSGGLSHTLQLPQAHTGRLSDHDAVPGNIGNDQYSAQQLAALQGFMQQQPGASSMQDTAAAAAAAARFGNVDALAMLQQLQAQALLAAASGLPASQEMVPGMQMFTAAPEQQQMLAAALAQLGIKDPTTAAAAAAAAARGGGSNMPAATDPSSMAAVIAAAAAAATGVNSNQAAGLQAQQLAQMQAALASLNLQAQAQAELQAVQQAQLMQQLQQHYSTQQLLVTQAAAAAAAATALHQQQQGGSSSWHGDRRLSNAVAAGKLMGHGSGGSAGSSAGRRSSRGGDALGSGTRDSRKASSTGERSSRQAGATPDWRRIFVGNIGWWVDEDMLLRVFGDFGTILDAQVMWNTKLLAKGKRVNREFAFISYSTPEEAGRAIQGMHGLYIEGLTKDRDGLTVQYEAQGVGKPASQQQQSQHGSTSQSATQQHFLLHQLQQQQVALQLLQQQQQD